jgi:hypothetical protein
VTYVYIRTEPGLWTVGFYRPDGKFEPESDHSSSEEAAGRVAWLNGVPPMAPHAKDGKPPCLARFSARKLYSCTAAEGHQGDHVAYGLAGNVIVTWPAEQVPDV